MTMLYVRGHNLKGCMYAAKRVLGLPIDVPHVLDDDGEPRLYHATLPRSGDFVGIHVTPNRPTEVFDYWTGEELAIPKHGGYRPLRS
jgi:hypothetical protein